MIQPTTAYEADYLRHEIAQMHTYRRALLAFLAAMSAAALAGVVSAALQHQAYTTAAITVWCGIVVTLLSGASFAVIGMRDAFARDIHAREMALLRYGGGQLAGSVGPGGAA